MMKAPEFKEEVMELAGRMGVNPEEIHIRKMKNKWASCSQKGRLTFDTSLLKQSDDFRLHVIIHELLHFKYPNHGKMFKKLLDVYLEREKQERGLYI